MKNYQMNPTRKQPWAGFTKQLKFSVIILTAVAGLVMFWTVAFLAQGANSDSVAP